MDAKQYRLYVASPVLSYLALSDPSREEIMMMTAAQESHMGHYIHQLGNGPALGIDEMEPFTYADMWHRVLPGRPSLMEKVRSIAGAWHAPDAIPDPEEMIGNLNFATAMAVVKYLSIPAKLPPADQPAALAIYYKKYYNTAGGAAQVHQVLENYHRYVEAA